MKRIVTLTVLNLLLCTIALAVPARRDPFTITQPNGDSIQVRLVGDEHWHAHYTIDGYMIKQDARGWWRYAKYTGKTYTDNLNIERKVTKATCRKAHDEARRSNCEKRWLKKHGINRGEL